MPRVPEWELLGVAGRLAGFILGWSLDEDAGTVTYFVVADEPLPSFPAQVDGFAVLLAPLPRPSGGVLGLQLASSRGVCGFCDAEIPAGEHLCARCKKVAKQT